MHLSSRAKLAVNVLVYLALREQCEPVPLPDLAQRHKVSLSHLEQIVAKLRRRRLIEPTKGPGGGYTLGPCGDAVNVAEIVRAVDGDGTKRVRGKPKPVELAADLAQEFWRALQSAVMTHLETVTLKSLADQYRARDHPIAKRVRQRPRPRQPVA